ncbi:Fasciclin domain-containing protein [Pedobacter nyackensis]|uniref:Fasciclin domain-containing protein n=2 Tax=Pedobacter nyackensis TaxID=475255 RepID=A0A1W2B9D9_9SPHI|nr:Fasciclin domain-containing protein [Pedobacter nyackensis]
MLTLNCWAIKMLHMMNKINSLVQLENINMKTIKKLIAPAILISCMAFAACEKLPLQKNEKYEPSHYDSNVHMSVVDFMNSRPDMFSGMIDAIEYVDKDPNYKDVKQLYTQSGNTYLLLHNNATTNIEDANSYFSLNKFLDKDPTSPTYNQTVKGSAWSQYPVDRIANMLRYHVLKGAQDFDAIGKGGNKWVDTYALSSTNDSAKVYMMMEPTRDGGLFINNYLNPVIAKLKPRTPDLHATNGVIHVMTRFITQPKRSDIINTK